MELLQIYSNKFLAGFEKQIEPFTIASSSPGVRFVQTGKTTAIRRIAVRETGVSRHRGDQLKNPWNPSGHHITVVLRGLKVGPQLHPHYAESLQSVEQQT